MMNPWKVFWDIKRLCKNRKKAIRADRLFD